jgi:putative transposase
MLKKLAEAHPRWGFDKMMTRIKKLNWKLNCVWNHKRVYRIYCELKLNLRKNPKKRIPKGKAVSLVQPIRPNICWSIDFMSDALTSGLKFRTFNIIDDYNREALDIEIGFSIPAEKITLYLDTIAMVRGYPEMIRVDNGPEFTSSWFHGNRTQNKFRAD